MNETVRIGIVQSVDTQARTARVYFPDTKIMSGPLTVIRTDHSAAAWMPGINDAVLCLYSGTFNADGFIIGGV